ncbi:MAG: chemotaxis protein CheW [Methanomicrobiales archaeon]|nr:chemotaxis protein CheW [Methanomicrobiales archaeon]
MNFHAGGVKHLLTPGELPANRAKRENLLIFQFGTRLYAVTITTLQEVLGCPAITPLPHAPDYIAGAIDLRDLTVNVIDISRVIRVEGSDTTGSARILVVDPGLTGNKTYGLIVTAIAGILELDEERVEKFERNSRLVMNDYMIGRFRTNASEEAHLKRASTTSEGADKDLVIWIDLAKMVSDITTITDGDEIELRLIRLFDPYQIVKAKKRSLHSR